MIAQFFSYPFLENVFYHNTLATYIDAVLVFCLVVFVSAFVTRLVLYRLRKIAAQSHTDIDDVVLLLLERGRLSLYIALGLYVASHILTLNVFVERSIFSFLVMVFVWYLTTVLQDVVDFFIHKKFNIRQHNPHLEAAMELFTILIKFGLWALAILLILSNLGVNIISLLAGVGIGGIAIAFAVKGILEDLFSSFSLYLDKPFTIGDLIDVDGDKGIVQRIGIKTTRLRSLATGEEIVYANSDLTKKKIHNFRRMAERRVSFKIGIVYETSTDKLKKIPHILEEIISSQTHAHFNRAHMRSFDDSAIVFSILYHVDTRDYDVYLRTHEDILFALRDAFGAEGITFAYPTQTIYLAQS